MFKSLFYNIRFVLIFVSFLSLPGYGLALERTSDRMGSLIDAAILIVPFKTFSNEVLSDGIKKDILSDRRHVMNGIARGFEARGVAINGIDELKSIMLVDGETLISDDDSLELAKKVNADFMLQGSISKFDAQYSLDLKLTKVKSNELLSVLYITASTIKELDEKISDVVREFFEKIFDNVDLKKAVKSGVVDVVDVVGNVRVDSLAVKQKSLVRPGMEIDSSIIKESIFNIYNMGFFEDIGVDIREVSGKTVLTYMVTEKSYVKEVLIKGNKEISEERLKEIISTKENTMIDPVFISQDKERLKQFYKSEGFYLASVEVDIEIRGIDALITYNINEGPNVRVKRITFIGNKEFSKRDLKDIINTKEKGLFSFMSGSGKYNSYLFRQDLEKIRQEYYNKGFVDMTVKDFRVLLSEDKKWFYITIALDEGNRYRIGEISVEGDMLEDVTREELEDEILLKEGAYFNKSKFKRSTDAITDIYGERGYANAVITPKTQKNEEEKTVAIVVDITKNNLVYIERIDIDGNKKTRDNVIRREFEVGETELFSPSSLNRSRGNLRRLGYFDDVIITESRGSSEDKVNITVQVKERPTGTLSASVGYSTTDKVVTTFALSQNNLFGKSYKLNLSANFSDTTKRYNLGFTNPWLMGKPISGGFDIYNILKDYPDFSTKTKGFNLRMGFPIYKRIGRANFTYTYNNVTLYDVDEGSSTDISSQQGDSEVRSLTAGIRFDARDDRFFPRKGYIFRVKTTVAGGALGGSTNYFEHSIEGAKVIAMPFNSSFTLRAEGALIDSFGGEEPPIYTRYYLGGINTIRGFETRAISPKDPVTGDSIGGDMMVLFSSEILFPIFGEPSMRGVAFFDMGNATTHDTLEHSSLRRGAGLGLRWLSPMGPLRIEWGYNLDRELDERASLWDFTIGSSF